MVLSGLDWMLSRYHRPDFADPQHRRHPRRRIRHRPPWRRPPHFGPTG